ncbi:hypothetical protein VNO77_18369 [Canavalia gladiata]|uniref:Lipoxygenase n=1 Tax=Canavalia gladiata TaxID=3824 RepID=A0AAN9LKP4_CANGL
MITNFEGNDRKGKLGNPTHLEGWITTITPITAGESAFRVTFDWDEDIGTPGAFLIRNNHHSEFYLRSLTLENVPGQGVIHFICNSWVYPTHKYERDRIFFSNKTYLPSETPVSLLKYREEELENLRGNGNGTLQEWDRVYDYAYYNDLGDPDKGPQYARPVLGGSAKYPYPLRGRTDVDSESRLNIAKSLDIYVPRDERFGLLKLSDFLAYILKSIVQVVKTEMELSLFDRTPTEFDSFEDVLKLWEGGLSCLKVYLRLLEITSLQRCSKKFSELMVKEDKSAWRTDEEFAREMLAGVNPVVIRCLQAIRQKKLFILDHHDTLIPYLRRINSTSTKTYVSRTILFLKNDGTLKPLAIELSLPQPEGDQYGVISKVYTPAEHGVESSIWQLAKAYVAVNDSGYHQLISHWLHTHAVMEPFVIAANRQLSVLHPIHKLLHPHFRDTMNINAFARQVLINAGGILEVTVFPAKYAMEMSSIIYKGWVFPEQALPVDLIKRGVAVEDSGSPLGLRLVIEDYPYAELREVGQGDKKNEPWWPKMETCEELINTCTIIIWTASALHAATNFGQYPNAGFLPNRPTTSRRFMPEKGTSEYDELVENPDKVFLKTETAQPPALIGISLIEILSRHSSDEVYLGQRDTPNWKLLTSLERSWLKLRKGL